LINRKTQPSGGILSFRVIRTAEASWQGTANEGGGRIKVGSGAFEGPYSLRARVQESAQAESAQATNPEELVAAAEAGCFTMSLANVLGEAGHPAHDLRTTARVKLEQVGDRFDITSIELRTVGEVPGLDPGTFTRMAEQAKDCTVSRALAGTKLTLEASLAGGESQGAS
jgi:osmotically inducible protein OsmC